MDNIEVPNSVTRTLALGKKFIYDGKTTKEQIKDLEKLAEAVKEGNLAYWQETAIEIRQIKKQLIWDTPTRCLNKDDDWTITIKAELRQHKFAAQEFLETRPDICVMNADKGNKLIVMLRKTYLEKMNKYIQEEIKQGVYKEIINETWVSHHQNANYKLAKEEHEAWRKEAQKMQIKIEKMKDKQEGSIVAPMYGTIKLHKEGYPIRPIVADPNNALDMAQKGLKTVLKAYIEKENHPFSIKNTSQMLQRIDKGEKNLIEKGHQMYCMDIVAMYTNMNIQTFLKIIEERYDKNIYEQASN